MNEIVSFLESKEGLVFTGKTDIQVIINAEKVLDVHFADDYKAYLSYFGIACFRGHELTGICTSKRLNVVDATKEEKDDFIPEELYVVERTNIDGIIIWQSCDGSIYESQKGYAPQKIASSLIEYLGD